PDSFSELGQDEAIVNKTLRNNCPPFLAGSGKGIEPFLIFEFIKGAQQSINARLIVNQSLRKGGVVKVPHQSRGVALVNRVTYIDGVKAPDDNTRFDRFCILLEDGRVKQRSRAAHPEVQRTQPRAAKLRCDIVAFL